MISMPVSEIEARAKNWAKAVGEAARVVDGRSMVGGGSLPEESLPTKLLAITGTGGDVTSLARRLRTGEPPVIARVERDTLLLDPRTVDPADDASLLAALRTALQNASKGAFRRAGSSSALHPPRPCKRPSGHARPLHGAIIEAK